MVIIIFRKFMIAVSALLFRSNATFQLCMILLVMFGGYAMQVRHMPYMSMSERDFVVDQAEARALLDNRKETEAFLQAQQEKKQKSRSHKKIKIGEADGETLWADNTMSDNAAVFIFNYNNTESILLGCAVLVNLMGIMFESEFLQKDTYEMESLTYCCLGVIGMSLMYYFFVLYCEVMTAVFPNAAKCLKMAGSHDEKLQDKREEDDVGRIEDEVRATQTPEPAKRQPHHQLTLVRARTGEQEGHEEGLHVHHEC
jgi:hypothetical protein